MDGWVPNETLSLELDGCLSETFMVDVGVRGSEEGRTFLGHIYAGYCWQQTLKTDVPIVIWKVY